MNSNILSPVHHPLYENDFFSQWLGIELLKVEDGYCRLKMKVRKEMCNGFGVIHGGVLFALADSALAFASNTQAKKALSIEASISYLKPVMEDEVLIATAEKQHQSNRLGRYSVRLVKEDETLVALFSGTVYQKGEEGTTGQNV